MLMPEKYRVTKGPYASNPGDKGGAFRIPIRAKGKREVLVVIAGAELGWEHVSVSLASRTPTWKEMCKVKDLFWPDDVPVMQLHPAKADHINLHPNCLHLWRPLDANIPLPPKIMV